MILALVFIVFACVVASVVAAVLSHLVVKAAEMCIRDSDNTVPLIKTAMRELHEETGLKVTEEDAVSIINPCLFSTDVYKRQLRNRLVIALWELFEKV